MSFRSWERPTDEFAPRTPLETSESERFMLFTEVDERLLSDLLLETDETDSKFLWFLFSSEYNTEECLESSESLGFVKLTLTFLLRGARWCASSEWRSGEDAAPFAFCFRRRIFRRLAPSPQWFGSALELPWGNSERSARERRALLTSRNWFDLVWAFLSTSESELESDNDESSEAVFCGVCKHVKIRQTVQGNMIYIVFYQFFVIYDPIEIRERNLWNHKQKS